MKTIVIVSIVAALAAGCATRSQMQSSSQEIAKLKAELVEARQAARAAAGAPRVAAAAPAVPPPAYVPPPHAPVMGPPEDWAWMYEKPAGCENGPLSFVIKNQSPLFTSVFIDGKQIKLRGAYGIMPHLPPGQTAYVCLDRPGQHNVSGVGYAKRYQQLVEVERFSIDPNISSMDGNTFYIQDSTFLFH